MRLSLPEFARIRLKSRNSDGFWTTPAPCRLNGAKLRRILDRPRAVPPRWGETETDFGPPPPARCFTQLWKRRSHPRGSVALQAHGSVALQARGSVALSAHATDRIGAGNHLLSRQPPGSSRASPGRNHPLGQATAYWGRQIAYPNAQFPTPMPGAGARQDPPHSSARPGTQRRTGSAEAA